MILCVCVYVCLRSKTLKEKQFISKLNFSLCTQIVFNE